MTQLIFLIVYLILVVAYLLTLQKTLIVIKPKNRKVEYSLVWLMLIPVFNFAWNFILAKRISESIELEINESGNQMDGKPLYNLGVFCSIMYILTILSEFMKEGKIFIVVPGFIVWLYYWKKVAEYQKAISKLNMQ